MQVPVKVMIGGHQFTIDYKKRVKDDDGSQLAGEMVRYSRKISVSRKAHKKNRELFSTLFHELVHAALEVSGYSEKLKEREEESLVHALENMLAPLLCFNPKGPIKFKDIEMEIEE